MQNLKTLIAVVAAAFLATACAKKEEAPPAPAAEAPAPAAETPAAPADTTAPAETPAPDAATNSADDPQSGGDKVKP
jgi:hypothetical protein